MNAPDTPNQVDTLSDCHHAPTKSVGGLGDFRDDDRAVTMHYECTKCGEPCDIAYEHNVESLEQSQDTASLPQSNQVDAVDELLNGYGLAYMQFWQSADKDVTDATRKQMNEAKAKLNALLVAARLQEHKELALDTYQGQTFSKSTNWQGKFDKFIKNNEYRIEQLEKQREATE